MVLATTELEDDVRRLDELEDYVRRLEGQIKQLYSLVGDCRREIIELSVITNNIEGVVNKIRSWTPWLLEVWRWWFNDQSGLPHWLPSTLYSRSSALQR
jgi:hypothetical protein